MSWTAEEIASVIKEIVTAEGQVLGSRLSQEIKDRCPEWQASDFAVRNLREFVTTHVPDVKEAGRSGMDVRYSLVSTTSTVRPATDFWRVWVSPNSPYVLAIERDGGTVHAVPKRDGSPQTQLRVEPPGVADHRDIAKAFLKHLPDELQERMLGVVESTGKMWWQEWLKELDGTEHLTTWSRFRHEQFETLLRYKLNDGELDSELIESVIRQVHDSHKASPRRGRRATVGDARETETDEAIRKLVVLAVQRMSVAELRDLRLPLGIVLDVLATSKSQ